MGKSASDAVCPAHQQPQPKPPLDQTALVEAVWIKAAPQNGVLPAQKVALALKPSGLPDKMLRSIWTKAKHAIDAEHPAHVMNKQEFTQACHLTTQLGGVFTIDGSESVASVSAPATKNNTTCNDAHNGETCNPEHVALWETSGAVDGHLPADAVSRLLKQSGLGNTELRKVWAGAKTAAPPHDKMSEAEFMAACKLAVQAGGDFSGCGGYF
jgi:hypothetical protein